MTICIAAICENSDIIAIADKKLTINLGVTAVYEINENKKIVQLTPSCAALFAGNVTSANEVLKKVKPLLAATDSIEEIAKKIIAVSNQVYNLGFEVLVIGKDNGVPQILKISENCGLSDETPIGYACVGSGSGHTNLSLIESRCHPAMRFENALHAVVKAKRKAESDPHVGEKSDILVLKNSVKLIDDKVIKQIFVAFDASENEITEVAKRTSKKIGGILHGSTTK